VKLSSLLVFIIFLINCCRNFRIVTFFILVVDVLGNLLVNSDLTLAICSVVALHDKRILAHSTVLADSNGDSINPRSGCQLKNEGEWDNSETIGQTSEEKCGCKNLTLKEPSEPLAGRPLHSCGTSHDNEESP